MMEKHVYSRIVNVCIGVAIIAVLLYPRASTAGEGWIAVSLIALVGLISISVYFWSLWNEEPQERRVDKANELGEPMEVKAFCPTVPKLSPSVVRVLNDITHVQRGRYPFRHQEMLRRQVGMILREEMFLQPESFNRLCSILLAEASWHAKDSERIVETINRMTKAENEMELIVVSKAPSGTIFFKIRTSPAIRPKAIRPDRTQIVEQVFDWVDATSFEPA